MQKTTLGLSIEALVCAFLELQGLRCVHQNYRCRLGEIDLVMQDPSTRSLIFVEVRFRAGTVFGNATESVNWSKQCKLKRAVLHYLQKHADASQTARIDVIGVSKPSAQSELPQPVFDYAVSMHTYKGHTLHWTRNAIED